MNSATQIDPPVKLPSDTIVAVTTPAAPASPPEVEEARFAGSSRHRGNRIRVTILLSLLAIVILVSAFMPLPQSATIPDAMAVLQPPSATHWFGTDESGLDVFARTIRSAHIDLLVAMGAVALSSMIGSTLGLLAGGMARHSTIFMRAVDIVQAFPGLILVLAVLSLIQGGPITILCTIALLQIAPFIRLVRSEAIVVRESGYVEFAEIIGVSRRAIIFRHILRNVTGTIAVQASVAVAAAIGVLASISFLGFGVAPPTPTWGGMIQSGVKNITSGAWWAVFFPALALSLAILTFNRIADDVATMLAKDQA